MDNRTLYEKLQANEEAKQEAYEEAHKMKNMCYTGMDEEEYAHLERVAKDEHESTVLRRRAEGEEIKAFRRAARSKEAEMGPAAAVPLQKIGARLRAAAPTKKSQLELIAGGIKRKPMTEVPSPKRGRGGSPEGSEGSEGEGGGGGLVGYGSSSDEGGG